MRFHIKEVTEKAELDAIIEVLWAAMDGIEPFHALFFPTFGTDPQSRETAILESKDRLWKAHKADPVTHWIYAREEESGRVIGGCQWRFYQENPFPEGGKSKVTATWWPEGSSRLFANEVVSQCHGPRRAWMARPHAGLTLMCVLPEMQRQGVGSALMEWGFERIDQLGLESFIEASVPGRILYEKVGYISVATVQVSMENVDVEKDDEWKHMENTKLPIGYTAVWRPKGGKVLSKEEVDKTWAERFQVPMDTAFTRLVT